MSRFLSNANARKKIKNKDFKFGSIGSLQTETRSVKQTDQHTVSHTQTKARLIKQKDHHTVSHIQTNTLSVKETDQHSVSQIHRPVHAQSNKQFTSGGLTIMAVRGLTCVCESFWRGSPQWHRIILWQIKALVDSSSGLAVLHVGSSHSSSRHGNYTQFIDYSEAVAVIEITHFVGLLSDKDVHVSV